MSARLSAPERRQQILDRALEAFGVGGYDAASMSAIAAAAGITKPVVYQHFVSKRALFLEVLADCGQGMVDAIEKATAEAAGPRDQVARGYAAFVGYFHERPAAFQVLFSEASRSDPEFGAEVHRVEMAVAERIAALITDGDLSPADRLVVAHGIVGMAERACRHWMDEAGDLDADRLAELLTRLTWAGVRGHR